MKFTAASRPDRRLVARSAHRRDVRVALVAETFTPAVNGVVNSVLRIADQLVERGHEPVVIAPTGHPFRTRSGARVEVLRVRSIAVPGYRGLRVTGPSADLRPIMADIAPDLVHLASPALLGRAAMRAANAQAIPTVAVFQTDLASYLPRYHLGLASAAVWSGLRRLHNRADLTLAPSSATAYQLRRHGVERVAVWARGVDGELFHPARRDERLRSRLLDRHVGQVLVGFVGRLAPEKRVELLAPLSREPGVRLVVVGDGPRRAALERAMPAARFLGLRTGEELARIVASLDLLVQPGRDETFCQVVQEALCAGVPVVAAASGGPLDLVRHGENGWLWAGDDPKLLSAQVCEIKADWAGLAATRARARPSVIGRTWTVVADQLMDHYARVLAGRPPDHVVVPIAPRRPARPAGRSAS